MYLLPDSEEKELTLEEAGNRLSFFVLLFKKNILMILSVNLMFCLSSLAIITMIPAYGALQYSFYCLIHEDSAMLSNFWKGFKTIIFKHIRFVVLQVVCFIVMVSAGLFYYTNGFIGNNPVFKAAACLIGIGLLHGLMMSVFYYPEIFSMRKALVKDVVERCFKLCLISFLPTFLYLVMFISGFYLLKLYPFLMILFTTFYFSIAAMIGVFMHDYYSEQLDRNKR